jgi:hypothetical protein
MADEPFYSPNYVALPRKPRPAEPLFSFQRGSRLICCELRYHGEFGVEAQFLKDGELFFSRRFDTRAQAVQWAEIERETQRQQAAMGFTDQ